MKVYALVGPSGTGKSHRAARVAYENDIDYIIDDGLLICGGKKIAGHSAKKEETSLRAVKRAIFMYGEHRGEMLEALEKVRPEKILLLGTSVRMVNRITQTLGLPDPVKIIFINDIASEEEIRKAREKRVKYGEHVIPLPKIEVRKDFPNYFIDSIHFLFSKKGRKKAEEKSVVRPKFNWLGKLVVSERTIGEIVTAVALGMEGIPSVGKSVTVMEEDSVSISLCFTVTYGTGILPLGRELRERITAEVEEMTGLRVSRVDMTVEAVAVPAETEEEGGNV